MARFVLSKKVLLQQYEKIRKACDEVAYSLKTNPIVGKILEKMTDSSFEIFSPFLIDEIEDKNRILYTVLGEKESGKEFIIKGRSADFPDIFRYKVFFDREPKIGGKNSF